MKSPRAGYFLWGGAVGDEVREKGGQLARDFPGNEVPDSIENVQRRVGDAGMVGKVGIAKEVAVPCDNKRGRLDAWASWSPMWSRPISSQDSSKWPFEQASASST